MNLRGKGSVSQPKIPLEWADVRSAGQVPAQCGCEGGRERGRKGVGLGRGGERENTHASICGRGSGHTGLCVFRSDSRQSTLFHSIPRN